MSNKSDHHIAPFSMYLKTYLALLLLMALTVFVGILPHKVPIMYEESLFNNAISLGVAVTKALLVIMFFMGVKYSSQVTKFFAVLGFACLLLLFGTITDYFSRSQEVVQGWENVPPLALPRGKPGGMY